MSKSTNGPDLHDFDGHEVLSTSVVVTNAGDGLSQAMTIEPEEFTHGQVVHIVLRCEVTKVAFTPIKDTDALTRVHTLRAGMAVIVDEKLVKAALDAQTKKIEESKGIQRLPDVDD